MVNKNERIISLPSRSARTVDTTHKNRFPNDDLWNLCVDYCHLVGIIDRIHTLFFVYTKT